MKIVDIRTIPLSYRCDPPYGSAGGMQARRGGLLVEYPSCGGAPRACLASEINGGRQLCLEPVLRDRNGPRARGPGGLQ
jgi:hypothetical protein